jgi:hypothetical protein
VSVELDWPYAVPFRRLKPGNDFWWPAQRCRLKKTAWHRVTRPNGVVCDCPDEETQIRVTALEQTTMTTGERIGYKINCIESRMATAESQLRLVGDALEPIRDWYDEGHERPLCSVVRDAVADLRQDRKQCLRYRRVIDDIVNRMEHARALAHKSPGGANVLPVVTKWAVELRALTREDE